MAQATIKKGAQGADVEELQKLLAAAGFPSSDPSGVFGDATDAAVRAYQAAKGLTADGIVGPMTWASLTGKPSFKKDKNAVWARGILESIWQEIVGDIPNLGALQILQAQAAFEGGYGLANYENKLTGEKKVLNNWGAVQAVTPNGGNPPCPPDYSFEVTDTDANGKPYQHCYRLWKTPEEGARVWLRTSIVKGPTEASTAHRHAAYAAARQGDIDAFATELRASGYFEASVEKYATALASRVNDIAGTIGEPIAARRGGPVDPGTATGENPPGEEGGFDLPSGKQAAGPLVVLVGVAGLIATVLKWGWPWTWRF